MKKQIQYWLFLIKEEVLPAAKTLSWVIILFVFVVSMPKLIRNYLIADLQEECVGIVDDIEIQKGLIETLEGTKVVDKAYLIHFHYQVDNQWINSSEYIVKKSLNIQQKTKMKTLSKGDTISVKFKPNEKNISRIDI